MSIPIGMDRTRAERWLDAKGIEHTYTDDPSAFFEDVPTPEAPSTRYGGLIRATLPTVDRLDPSRGKIQISILLDRENRVARHRVRRVPACR